MNDIKDNKKTSPQPSPTRRGSMLPQDYSWGRMIVIGLGVLGIGLAIAFVGLVLFLK